MTELRSPSISRHWVGMGILVAPTVLAPLLFASTGTSLFDVMAYLYALAVSAMAVALLARVFDFLKLWVLPRDIEWCDPPRQVVELAARYGVADKIKKFGFIPGSRNAGVNPFGTMLVGSELQSSDGKIDEAVLAHECGHLQQFSKWWYWPVVFGPGLLAYVAASAYLEIHWMFFWPVFAGTSIVLFSLSRWVVEVNADDVAAKGEGTARMIATLGNLAYPPESDGPSLTHPSLQQRIRRLRRRAGWPHPYD